MLDKYELENSLFMIVQNCSESFATVARAVLILCHHSLWQINASRNIEFVYFGFNWLLSISALGGQTSEDDVSVALRSLISARSSNFYAQINICQFLSLILIRLENVVGSYSDGHKLNTNLNLC